MGGWVHWEQKKLYITLKGSGYRRNRRLGNNNPVVNTFRQWADAQAWPAVILEQVGGVCPSRRGTDSGRVRRS